MTVQSEVYVIILLTVILGIAIVVIGKKVEKADPFAEPQGILKPVLLGMTTVYNSVKTNVGKATADKLTPYITVLWVYIFMSNTVSLFGLESPTANLSVTLLLAFITWVLIQVTELKYGGLGAYLHAFIEPIPLMLPMNIVGKFSTICSMALRLFGNITCGGIMMQLIYAGAQLASNAIAGLVRGGRKRIQLYGAGDRAAPACLFRSVCRIYSDTCICHTNYGINRKRYA